MFRKDALMQIQQQTVRLEILSGMRGRNGERQDRIQLPEQGSGGPNGRKTVRENEVEQKFRRAVEDAGGIAFKFTSQTANGVPDRLVLMMGGKCAFVELKAPGKQMRLLQRKRRLQLQALGFPVFCVDRLEQIKPVIKALENWKPGEPFPENVGAPVQNIKTIKLPSEARKRGERDGF